jgi:hypothetical protein
LRPPLLITQIPKNNQNLLIYSPHSFNYRPDYGFQIRIYHYWPHYRL